MTLRSYFKKNYDFDFNYSKRDRNLTRIELFELIGRLKFWIDELDESGVNKVGSKVRENGQVCRHGRR